MICETRNDTAQYLREQASGRAAVAAKVPYAITAATARVEAPHALRSPQIAIS